MEGHLLDGTLAGEEGVGAVRVGARFVAGHRGDLRQIGVVDLRVLALCHAPDALVTVGRQGVADAHLLLHDLVVGNVGSRRVAVRDERSLFGLVGEGGTSAVDIVAVDRPIPGVPLGILLIDRGPETFPIAARRGLSEQRLEQDGGDRPITRVAE